MSPSNSYYHSVFDNNRPKSAPLATRSPLSVSASQNESSPVSMIGTPRATHASNGSQRLVAAVSRQDHAVSEPNTPVMRK